MEKFTNGEKLSYYKIFWGMCANPQFLLLGSKDSCCLKPDMMHAVTEIYE
jgi:hypothetical protein